jgi:hypothetical protein
MRLDSGTEVARVEITITGFTGPGTYAATEPLLQYRSRPVQVVTAFNAATGLKRRSSSLRAVAYEFGRVPRSWG